MIQCVKCDNWKLIYIDEGKKHFGCKKSGHRSLGKWKKHQCSAFEIKEDQMLLSEV